MSEHRHKHRNERLRFVLRTAAVVLCVALAGGIAAFALLTTVKEQHVVRGVTMQEIELGNLSEEAASKELEAAVASLRLTYVLNGERLTLEPTAAAAPIASFDERRAVTDALAVGRGANPVKAFVERLTAATAGRNVTVSHTLDRVALRAMLDARFSGGIVPANDAAFVVTFSSGTPSVTVTEGRDGMTVDYDAVMSATEQRLTTLSANPIVMAVRKDRPAVNADDLEPLTPLVAEAVSRAPFTLVAKNETWTVSPGTFAGWITAAKKDGHGDPELTLDKSKLETYVTSRSAAVNVMPKDALFEEKDGKVVTFVPGQNGEAVDLDGAVAAITAAAFGAPDVAKRIVLPFTSVPPAITTEASNPYGIKEVIGTGATNFRGSPANRRHNIAIGAKSAHGTLIPPGEEFSMIKTLGVIDGTTGYKQELVIKENKTTPEYGGGLCQIGSTAFRAALDSGLPITMRQNHSYRVPYYERDGDGNDIGPGKDATIYDPLPDFRFLNDTGHHILITTAINGDRASFTFWGVRDGRVAEQTRARVYNLVQPPPKKVILTTDLKPGQVKCTETAHVGSDAVFTYTVTYAGGEVKKRDFQSHYRPWQEVCLEGVDPSQLPEGVTSQEKITSPDSAAADAPEVAAPAAPPATPATP